MANRMRGNVRIVPTCAVRCERPSRVYVEAREPAGGRAGRRAAAESKSILAAPPLAERAPAGRTRARVCRSGLGGGPRRVGTGGGAARAAGARPRRTERVPTETTPAQWAAP